MALNDPNDVVLDVDEPWMNFLSFFTQKVESDRRKKGIINIEEANLCNIQ